MYEREEAQVLSYRALKGSEDREEQPGEKIEELPMRQLGVLFQKKTFTMRECSTMNLFLVAVELMRIDHSVQQWGDHWCT